MTTLEIVKQLDPWTVACAVGAMNGSIYGDVGSRGAVNFDIWLRMVNREKWPPSIPPDQIETALREFANENRGTHMMEIPRKLNTDSRAPTDPPAPFAGDQ